MTWNQECDPFPRNMLVYTARMGAELGAGALHKTQIPLSFISVGVPGGIPVIYASSIFILSLNYICSFSLYSATSFMIFF